VLQFAHDMTREQYEQRKRRLDEQLREGVELLGAAHRQQVRALELVWSMDAEETLSSRAPAVETEGGRESMGAPAPSRIRRGPGELESAVEAVLGSLPEVFDRNDVCRAIGYEPDRGSLYRILEDLRQAGRISVQQLGSGRVPTRYRKSGALHSPSET
jgi:hypothetical protein